MDATRLQFLGRRRAICLRMLLWVSIPLLVTMMGTVVLGGERQADQVVKLSVEGGRPVAKAVEMLEARYGWMITYEDPRYVHESDIRDVTYQVRRDLDKYEPGKAPKVLVPRGGQINMDYVVSPVTGKPETPAALLQHMLYTHAANGNPGVFRLEQSGEFFHVIPSQVKDSEGLLVVQESILDTKITFSEEERVGVETLDTICAAIRRATQIDIGLGTIPMNLFFQHRSRQGAVNERARDVLVRTLEGTKRKLAWQLFYGPGRKGYSLNIHLVRKKEAEGEAP